MKKPFYLLTILFLIPFFTGHQSSAKNPWKDIKISELINKQQPLENKFMSVGLHIYLFQINTDKLARIQYQIRQTDELPIKYNEPNAFLANGLVGGGGDRKSWQKMATLLTKARVQIKKHINLTIAEDLTNNIIVAEAAKPVSAIYYSDGTTAGIGFDAGQIVLRIKASSLIGLRQACKLDVTPVYKIITSQEPQKSSTGGNYEFTFDSAAFNVRLEPGQFILLAPAQAKIEQTETQTIGNLLFYRQRPKKTVDLCLIACNLISSPL